MSSSVRRVVALTVGCGLRLFDPAIPVYVQRAELEYGLSDQSFLVELQGGGGYAFTFDAADLTENIEQERGPGGFVHARRRTR